MPLIEICLPGLNFCFAFFGQKMYKYKLKLNNILEMEMLPISINYLKDIGNLKIMYAEVQSAFCDARNKQLDFYQKSFLNEFKTYFFQNGFQVNADQEINQIIADYGNGTIKVNVEWTNVNGQSTIKITEETQKIDHNVVITYNPLANYISTGQTSNDFEKLHQDIKAYEEMTKAIINIKYGYYLEEERGKYKRFDDARALITTLFPPES